MRRLTLLTLALLSWAATAQTGDSLDWSRYYPLAVGNVWEYHDAEARGDLTRVTLMADTVAGGETYFHRRTERAAYTGSLDGPLTPISTALDFVRYGEGGVVTVSAIEADTVQVEPCAEDGFERDLRLGFGTRQACGISSEAEPDSVFVDGEYEATWAPDPVRGTANSLAVAAIKRYTVGGVVFTEFVADVGPTQTGDLGGPRLHYALVGGVEYGAAEFATAGESYAPSHNAYEVRALGNPSSGQAAFDVRGPSPQMVEAVVHDVLGREVWSANAAVGPDWRRMEVPPALGAAGPYVLTVSGPDGRTTARFTVVR